MHKQITLALVSTIVALVKSAGLTEGVSKEVVAEKLGYENYDACEKDLLAKDEAAKKRLAGTPVGLDFTFEAFSGFTIAAEVRHPDHEHGEGPEWAFISIGANQLNKLLNLRNAMVLESATGIQADPYQLGLHGDCYPKLDSVGSSLNLEWYNVTVKPAGFSMVGYPRHSEVRCKTAEIGFHDLVEALQSRKPGDGTVASLWLTNDLLVMPYDMDSKSPTALLDMLQSAIGEEETETNAEILKLLPSYEDMEALENASN